MLSRRATVLLWVAGALVAAGVVAFWIEWERAALPSDDVLAAQIISCADGTAGADLWGAAAAWGDVQRQNDAPERVSFGGWEFRLAALDGFPPGTLVRTGPWLVVDAESDQRQPAPILLARPLSRVAKIRLWFGAFPDDWLRATSLLD